MKIAYVLLDPGIGVFGTKGASVHVQEMIRALRADGHEVTVFCTRTDDAVPADLADLEICHLPLPRRVDPAGRERAVRATAADIARRIATGGFGLVHERYSLFSDVAARLAEGVDGVRVPTILEVNAPLVEEQRTHRNLVDEAGARALTWAQLRSADVVSCVSEPVARWAQDEGARPSAVRITPNGVNTRRITPASGPRPQRPVTVGFVGTLKRWHGTDTLLRALARTSTPMRLEIIGTGPEAAPLAQLAEDLGITDRVTFHGAVAPERVPQLLHGLDVACAPYPEAQNYFSPLKVYEYLAAGLPVVASDIGAVPQILEDGHLGVLVTPGNATVLAEALDELACDPVRREQLSGRARAAALAQHDWRIRSRELLDAATAVHA